jgi:hypothetical protein
MPQLQLAARASAAGFRDFRPAYSARYSQDLGVRLLITVLSQAHNGDREQRKLPPKEQEHALSQFRLADWFVPPLVVPLFLLILILVAALLHG